MLQVCVVGQTTLCDSWHSYNINAHDTFHIKYIFSEKEAALGLPQLGVSFLADSNSWKLSKPQKCEADAQSTETAGF